MNRFFGRTAGPPQTSLSEASSVVGNLMESMDAKIHQLNEERKQYRSKLKTTKNPKAKKTLQKRAMEVLKRIRMHEVQRDQLARLQYNIDQAALGVESAEAVASTVAAMKAANKEMKATIIKKKNNGNLEKIDGLDDLVDDTAELMEELISKVLAQNFATPDYIDDDVDLEAELDLLGDESSSSSEGEIDAVTSYLHEPMVLPPAPTGVPQPTRTINQMIREQSAQMEPLELEYGIDPEEDDQDPEMLVPRDLRDRRCHIIRSHTHGSACTIFKAVSKAIILPLAVFAISYTLMAKLFYGDLVDEVKPVDSSRALAKIHVGFDGSEALGAKRANVPFKDIDGTLKEPIQIFKDHGYTYSRLRVMVSPSGSFGLFQDIEYVKEMAREIVHKNSMKLLLDFHYSHWWADPENQWVPLDWINDDDEINTDNITLATLKKHVYDHTRAVMEELILQDTIPDAVQIGNEVNEGMLWEEGRIVDGDMQNFVQLTNSANDAIRDSFFANDVTTSIPQIVMHLASGGSKDFTEWWFTTFAEAGGVYDIVGLSYYPQWHGSFEDLADNMKNIKTVFPDKHVWVVETAYYWTETSSDFDKLPYDQSEDGQFEYLRALLDVLTDYGHDTAVFYWGSHWTQANRWMNSDETWEDAGNRSLFNADAQALKAIDALIRQQ